MCGSFNELGVSGRRRATKAVVEMGNVKGDPVVRPKPLE
jgi:hypothetical protein